VQIQVISGQSVTDIGRTLKAKDVIKSGGEWISTQALETTLRVALKRTTSDQPIAVRVTLAEPFATARVERRREWSVSHE